MIGIVILVMASQAGYEHVEKNPNLSVKSSVKWLAVALTGIIASINLREAGTGVLYICRGRMREHSLTVSPVIHTMGFVTCKKTCSVYDHVKHL